MCGDQDSPCRAFGDVFGQGYDSLRHVRETLSAIIVERMDGVVLDGGKVFRGGAAFHCPTDSVLVGQSIDVNGDVQVSIHSRRCMPRAGKLRADDVLDAFAFQTLAKRISLGCAELGEKEWLGRVTVANVMYVADVLPVSSEDDANGARRVRGDKTKIVSDGHRACRSPICPNDAWETTAPAHLGELYVNRIQPTIRKAPMNPQAQLLELAKKHEGNVAVDALMLNMRETQTVAEQHLRSLQLSVQMLTPGLQGKEGYVVMLDNTDLVATASKAAAALTRRAYDFYTLAVVLNALGEPVPRDLL